MNFKVILVLVLLVLVSFSIEQYAKEETRHNTTCKCVRGKNVFKRVCCHTKEKVAGNIYRRVVFQKCVTESVYADRRDYSCHWAKNGANVSQLRCCLTTSSCCPEFNGGKCKVISKKCSWKGKALKPKFVRGCEMKLRGKDVLQKWCCNSREVCDSEGFNCNMKRFHCHWEGPKIQKTYVEKCFWKKVGEQKSQRVCCQIRRTCRDSQCSEKQLKCLNTSEVLVKQRRRHCYFRRFQDGERKRCCRWLSACLHNKKSGSKSCLQMNQRCFWTGSVVRYTEQLRCKWVGIREGKKQKECCLYVKKCQGKVCGNKKVHCKLIGHIVSDTTKGSRCRWKLLSKTKQPASGETVVRQEECCDLKKICVFKAVPMIEGGVGAGQNMQKCPTRRVNCRKGRIISTVPERSCHWAHRGKAVQRKCCTWVKKCLHTTSSTATVEKVKSCSKYLQQCSWVGPTFQSTTKGLCYWKKSAVSHSKQRVCCKYRLRCVDGKCVKGTPQCKRVGSVHRQKKVSRCFSVQVGPHSKRRRCCTRNISCVGANCVPTKKQCQWVGQTIKSTVKTECKWVNPTKTTTRKMCMQVMHTCMEGKCSVVNGSWKAASPLYSLQTTISCKILKIRVDTDRKKCYQTTKRCIQEEGSNSSCVVLPKLSKSWWSGPAVKIGRKVITMWRQVSPYMRQQLQCTKVTTCTNTACSSVKEDCTVVRTLKILRQESCSWNIHRGGHQKRCCERAKQCQMSAQKETGCKTLAEHCRWVGPLIKVKKNQTCNWIQQQGGTASSKRLYCCKNKTYSIHSSSSSKHGPSKITSSKPRCQYVTPKHSRKYTTRCKYVMAKQGCNKLVKRARCCYYVTFCSGRYCHRVRGACRFIKGAKIVKLPHQAKPIKHCQLFADPHTIGFSGQFYNAQSVGDWLIYKGKRLSSSYRGVSQGVWTANVQWIVRVRGGSVIRSYGSGEGFTLNGEVFTTNGTQKVNKLVSVSRSGYTVTVSAPGETISFVYSPGWWYNTYVTSSHTKVSGVCSHQFIFSEDFDHPIKGRFLVKGLPPCPKKEEYKTFCRQQKLGIAHRKQCVFDLCSGITKDDEGRIIKRGFKEMQTKVLETEDFY